jgi:hypothetical protein
MPRAAVREAHFKVIATSSPLRAVPTRASSARERGALCIAHATTRMGENRALAAVTATLARHNWRGAANYGAKAIPRSVLELPC